MQERRAETLWDSIALHTIPSIAQHKGPNVACCQIGIACDYGGLGYNELSDDNKKAILSTFPRLGMKNELTTCLCGIAKNHPNTTMDNFIADFGMKYVPGYMRLSSVDFLHSHPLPSRRSTTLPRQDFLRQFTASEYSRSASSKVASCKQIFIELYNYRPAWAKCPESERTDFAKKVVEAVKGLKIRRCRCRCLWHELSRN